MFVPVFCLYASLPRTSLLQGAAATGAKWLKRILFVGLQGAETFVAKPDKAE